MKVKSNIKEVVDKRAKKSQEKDTKGLGHKKEQGNKESINKKAMAGKTTIRQLVAECIEYTMLLWGELVGRGKGGSIQGSLGTSIGRSEWS